MVLLVHGLNSTAKVWTEPAEGTCKPEMCYRYDHRHRPHGDASVRASALQSSEQINGQNWFDSLRRHDLTVATWSQPGKTFNQAYPSAVAAYRKLLADTRGPVALVGHSRGGLIIRKLLREQVLGEGRGGGRLKVVVTLHSPHRGSRVARLGWDDRRRLSEIVQRDIRKVSLETVTAAAIEAVWLPRVRDLVGFLLDAADEELHPDSALIRGLAAGDRRVDGVDYYSFGGTSPTAARVYAKVPQVIRGRPVYDYAEIQGISPFPETIVGGVSALLGEEAPEMRYGKGDSLVTDASARIPFAKQHWTNKINHAEVLWDRAVQMRVAAIISASATPAGAVPKVPGQAKDAIPGRTPRFLGQDGAR